MGLVRSVLALNLGSSSLKFGLFTLAAQPAELCRGTVAEPDRSPFDRIRAQAAAFVTESPLAAVVHRLVHGGPDLREPRLVDGGVLETLRGLVHLAPNHLPAEMALIEEIRRSEPDLPQIVCFDTAFHGTLPEEARRLPIAAAYAAQGVQRYGFHGLSCTFLAGELARRSGAMPRRAILAHLGNGSSLTAVLDGRSVDTTMGFTPLGGVAMSTRTGDLDPGVVMHLARSGGLDAAALEKELSHRSGLAGISGGVSDMRELLAREAAEPGCRLAVTIYCYEIRKRIGAYAAALGGLDALVFSGGIGEHTPVVRERICAPLGFLGIELDGDANAAGGPIISAASSRAAVHVIATDEEVVMARAAHALLE